MGVPEPAGPHPPHPQRGGDQCRGVVVDPFGQPLDPVTLAIGTTTADDSGTLTGNTGWHQGALKQAATVGSTTVIEMGARLYVPALGRFLQVDPVEGASENDYVWPTDPILLEDVSGELPKTRPDIGGTGGNGRPSANATRASAGYAAPAVRPAPPAPRQTSKPKPASSAGSGGQSYTVNWGQQAKHIPGHSGYLPGRSTITANPQRLVDRAGTGTPANNIPRGEAGFRERIDFGQNIGTYISRDGQALPTSIGILHYRADGTIHIVPGRPAH